MDSTTIDLCLSLFPWARFRSHKAAIKMHTLLDLRGPIPTFIGVSDGKLHDVNMLDAIVPEPASFYVMDRAYVDFQRLHVLPPWRRLLRHSHQERDPVPPAILSPQRRLQRRSIRS